MKKVNVGILGATGAVGREMLKILEERNFPVGELRLLASARSVESTFFIIYLLFQNEKSFHILWRIFYDTKICH